MSKKSISLEFEQQRTFVFLDLCRNMLTYSKKGRILKNTTIGFQNIDYVLCILISMHARYFVSKATSNIIQGKPQEGREPEVAIQRPCYLRNIRSMISGGLLNHSSPFLPIPTIASVSAGFE